MKYILVFFLSYILTSCSFDNDALKVSKEVSQKDDVVQVLDDLEKIPQDVSAYTKEIAQSDISHLQANYEKEYYCVWNYKKPVETVEHISWPFRNFNHTNSYGENLLPLSQEFFDALHEMSNFEQYLSLNKKALLLDHTNLRAMPTSRPVLRDPQKAGEGFPFDYLQNTSANANTPIFVSHYSKDKQWMFIFTSFAYGWVKSDEVVFIKQEYTREWQNSQQITITKENVALFSRDGKGLYDSRIGMRFPIIKENKDSYTVLVITSYKDNLPMYKEADISKSIAVKGYLEFNRSNLNQILGELKKSNYGWGGIYNQRDCSSTLMDMYAPFGIWLPRNSYKQSQIGDTVDLSMYNEQEKENFIKRNAIPFQTLLYRKGHIVLYVGTYNDEIVVFQNMWGIRTKSKGVEGRFIVGKTVYSSLDLGKELENYDEEKGLLKALESMNTITR